MASTIPAVFLPPRRRGLIYHGVALLVLAGASALILVLAIQREVSGTFSLLLLLSVLFFAPLPLVVYRGYALLNATYTIERDGLRIRWGLRAEDIPLPEIEWVRPVSDLGFHLSLPPLVWSGAILGSRDSGELGLVEFMGADASQLLLIATPRKVYAISPEDQRAFLRAFQYAMEMGSLMPLKAYSARPAAFARRVWNDRPARYALLAGLLLTVALLVQVSLAIPGQQTVSLGFDPQGFPLDPVPAEQLLLLPVLGVFVYIANLAVGVFFYRREENRPIAFMLWLASAFTPLLFIIAVILIL